MSKEWSLSSKKGCGGPAAGPDASIGDAVVTAGAGRETRTTAGQETGGTTALERGATTGQETGATTALERGAPEH